MSDHVMMNIDRQNDTTAVSTRETGASTERVVLPDREDGR